MSKWTKRDKKILKEYYPKGGAKAVQEQLPDKSLTSIRRRYKKLNAPKKPQGKQLQKKQPHYRNDEYTKKSSKNAWTDREIEILCFLFPTGGSAAVQERLPERSLPGIAREAENLHIQKAWTAEEMEILRQYYPIEGKKVVDRLPDRTSKQCETMAKFKGYTLEATLESALESALSR